MWALCGFLRHARACGVTPAGTLREWRLGQTQPLRVVPYVAPRPNRVVLPPFDDAGLLDEQIAAAWAACEMDASTRAALLPAVHSLYFRLLVADLTWIVLIESCAAESRLSRVPWGAKDEAEDVATIVQEESDQAGSLCLDAFAMVLRRVGIQVGPGEVEALYAAVQPPSGGALMPEGMIIPLKDSATCNTVHMTMSTVVARTLGHRSFGDVAPSSRSTDSAMLENRAARWAGLILNHIRPASADPRRLSRHFVQATVVEQLAAKVTSLIISASVILRAPPAIAPVVHRLFSSNIGDRTEIFAPAPSSPRGGAFCSSPRRPEQSGNLSSPSRNTGATSGARLGTANRIRGQAPIGDHTSAGTALKEEMIALFPKSKRRLITAPPRPEPPRRSSLSEQTFTASKRADFDLATTSGALHHCGVGLRIPTRIVSLTPRSDEVTERRQQSIRDYAANSALRASAVVEKPRHTTVNAASPRSSHDLATARRAPTAAVPTQSMSRSDLELARRERTAVRIATDRLQEQRESERAEAVKAAVQLEQHVHRLVRLPVEHLAGLRALSDALAEAQRSVEALMAAGGPAADGERLLRVHSEAAHALTRLKNKKRFARIEGLV
jgi:hypothetical protein